MTAARPVLDQAFLERHGWRSAARARLAGDASFRHYDRLVRDGDPAVLMDAPPPREDVRPFVAIARWLGGHGFSAPRILAADLDSGFLLLEDLGDDRYSRVIPRQPELETELYRAAVDVLVALHAMPAPRDLPCENERYAVPAYDEALYLRELYLFTDWYLPAVAGPVSRAEREEFAGLWAAALAPLQAADPVLVLRDYHADNLMWLPQRQGIARVGLLDFQDGVAGHAAYDLVSLLEDARRDVPEDLAEQMIGHYLDRRPHLDAQDFRRAYALLGAQRNLKIIGIFTRLWARDGKAAYLELLPRVWGLLERDLRHPALRSIKAWIDARVPSPLRRVAPRVADIPRLPKRAMVLGAGLGLRMRPLTDRLPKPLVEVGGEAMLDRILDQLAAAGVDQTVVNLHHLSEVMRRHLAGRADRLPAIAVSDESARLMDSGGGVKRAIDHFKDAPFFVLNGDMIWRDGGVPALLRLAMAYDARQMDALLLVTPRADAVGYDGAGDFDIDGNQRLTRRSGPSAPLVFTGIQILSPDLFADMPDEPFSLNRIYDRAAAAGRLYGLVHDGLWLHVGTMDSIALAEARLAHGGP